MSDSSIALKPVIDEPSKPMPSSSAPSTSLVVIEKLFRCPSRSVNQSSTSSMPRSLISFSTSLRAPGSDVALFSLSTCAMPRSSSLDDEGVYAVAASYPRRHGRALARAARRRRLAAPPRRLRGLDRAPRRRRLVLAPPERPPLGRRLGGAGQPVDPRRRRDPARLPEPEAAGVHASSSPAARPRRRRGTRAGGPSRGDRGSRRRARPASSSSTAAAPRSSRSAIAARSSNAIDEATRLRHALVRTTPAVQTRVIGEPAIWSNFQDVSKKQLARGRGDRLPAHPADPARRLRDARRGGRAARPRLRGGLPQRRRHLCALALVRDLGLRHEHGVDDRHRRRGRLLALHRQPLPP